MKKIFLVLLFSNLFSAISGATQTTVPVKGIIRFTEGPYYYRTGMSSVATDHTNYIYPRFEISDEYSYFLVHTEPTQKEVEKAVSSISEHFTKKQWPVYYLPDEATIGDKNGVWSLLPFHGDYHRIVAKTNNVVFGGKNFAECACNAVKSMIFQSQQEGPLNVYLITDTLITFGSGEHLFTEYTSDMDDDEFMKFLDAQYFDEKKILCKYDPATIEVQNRDFTFQVHRNGHLIGTRGNGKSQVNLIFQTAEEFIKSH